MQNQKGHAPASCLRARGDSQSGKRTGKLRSRGLDARRSVARRSPVYEVHFLPRSRGHRAS
eukprot:scaffold78983_cov75-Phaeocystis_antarctica.AAC.2